ncbi:MAG: pyridoxamine 5'-phosphate oxidase family protein [Candidatus Odinarchaeota archaeon]
MRDIRRKEKAIHDENEMIQILKECQYVTIATCRDNQPYLFTVSHGYEQDKIYFHCASEGKKIDYLKANNTVWGQALLDRGYVQGKCDHLYATCQFRGSISFVEDPVEKRHALEVMVHQRDSNPDEVIAEQLTDKSISRITIGRIDIDYMSGKKATKVIIST